MSRQNKILVIGNTRSHSYELLAAAAAQAGVTFRGVSGKDLSFDGHDVHSTSTGLSDFWDYDVYFFRGMPKAEDRLMQLQKLAATLKQNGKIVVEGLFADQLLPEDSYVPMARNDEYRVPETQHLFGDQILARPPSVPFVLKQFQSSMGKGVFKVVSDTDLNTLVHKEEEYIVQQFYEFTHDTRVFIVGGEVVGGLDRYRPSGEDFLTTRRGGERVPAVLTNQQVIAARSVAARKGLEIAGIDMFTYDGEVYIIEVNSSPQFFVFSKFTGINVAQRIVAYLLSHA